MARPSYTRVSARIKSFARGMRRQATEPEDLLWQLLRDRRFVSHKFRRQVPIGPYIADFACYSAKVIVELDGSQHGDSKRDAVRDAELAKRGFRIIRVWNNELTTNRSGVLDAIFHALQNKEYPS